MKKIIQREKHKVIRKVISGKTSFVSSPDHPTGLKCEFYVLDNGDLATTYEINEYHIGHINTSHGGITAAVLDETMGKSNYVYDEALGREYKAFMTGEMKIRYLAPLSIGERARAYGRVVREEGRKHYNTAEIIKDDGTVVAEAEGLFIRVEKDLGTRPVMSSPNLNETDPTEL